MFLPLIHGHEANAVCQFLMIFFSPSFLLFCYFHLQSRTSLLWYFIVSALSTSIFLMDRNVWKEGKITTKWNIITCFEVSWFKNIPRICYNFGFWYLFSRNAFEVRIFWIKREINIKGKNIVIDRQSYKTVTSGTHTK